MGDGEPNHPEERRCAKRPIRERGADLDPDPSPRSIFFGMAGGRKESRFGLSFVLSQNLSRGVNNNSISCFADQPRISSCTLGFALGTPALRVRDPCAAGCGLRKDPELRVGDPCAAGWGLLLTASIEETGSYSIGRTCISARTNLIYPILLLRFILLLFLSSSSYSLRSV